MSGRAHRMGRLVSLRERQHDAAAVRLQRARAAVSALEAAAERALSGLREARAALAHTAAASAQEAWLLANAQVEWWGMTLERLRAEQVTAQAALQQALEEERLCRQEQRQMESVRDRVVEEALAQAARAEQTMLDESSRHLSAASSFRMAQRSFS